MIFVISSDEPWGKMMHTQLHYALELSRKHTVYFIDPPRKWPPNLSLLWSKTRQINQNLFILPYLNLLPVIKSLWVTIRINDFINFSRIKRILRNRNAQKVILWRFDPQRMLTASSCKFYGTIYHVVDDYRGKAANRFLLQGSDLVITTSPRNQEYFSTMHKNVFCIPQAISDDELQHDDRESEKIRKQYGDFVLFTGTLSDANDFSLILTLVQHFSHYNFIFVGPEMLNESNKKLFETILSSSNACYLGTKDGKELKNFIHASSACIIPYHFTPKKTGDIRSPLKALHYLAQFKPVITSVDCEIDELENKAIYFANNQTSFIQLLDACLQKKNNYDITAVKNFLDHARYDKFIDKIIDLLTELKAARTE
ncbi:MAG: hypothetical protein JNL47_07430 [Bacteroidia bacterium]|nr:hypothetical protein [Bacteroidia bacterium]